MAQPSSDFASRARGPHTPRRGSKRDVVLAAAAGLLVERGGGRHGRWRAGAGPLGTAHELNALGDNLGSRALLAVLALPVTRLQPALDEDLAALVQVLAARLRLLAPHHDGEEARLLAPLARLGAVVAVHRQPQVGHRGAARRVTKLRGTREVSDQQYLVQARHQ